MKKARLAQLCKKTLPYLLVAVLASALTWFVADRTPNSKLERLADAIEKRFIGTADREAMEDAAAEAMIQQLGDRWSYYISAEEYADHLERQSNSYVGIGVTVQKQQADADCQVIAVDAEGPAWQAGVQVGDVITHVDGVSLAGQDLTQVRERILGEKNTQVVLTLLRGEEVLELSVTRKVLHSSAAEGQMLGEDTGYIRIKNFHSGAAEDTIALIGELQAQGAEKLIFDVRNNPGGYVHEMVDILDYLLPEGPLFRSRSYDGTETVDMSDADCLELPMAVLINGSTYSAAEFFAAALSEYDWAVTVGEATVGKGYYQSTIPLGDGSAVQLSIGAYTTPNGVNLTEAGGLTPDVPAEPAEDAVSVEADPQVQAAMQVLAA